MTIQSRSIRSEKGMALVTVLLLLAVVSALTTTLAMSGQTEIAMASNEMYYAGARAAAEAGLNRATEHLNDIPTLNLLAGIPQPAYAGRLRNVHSQYGEDGLLAYVLEHLPDCPRQLLLAPHSPDMHEHDAG